MLNLNDRQTARATIRIGRAVELDAQADLSTAGLIGIAMLVSGILLSTSVIVGTAIRESRRVRPAPPPLAGDDPA